MSQEKLVFESVFFPLMISILKQILSSRGVLHQTVILDVISTLEAISFKLCI